MIFWAKVKVAVGIIFAASLVTGSGTGVVASMKSKADSPPVQTSADSADKPGTGPPIEIHKNLSDKEWPQLQNTPQRTGYSPMQLKPPYEEKWCVYLPKTMGPDYQMMRVVQPIIAENRVYVGCMNGQMLALDAKTGDVKWEFAGDGPILHTAGYAGGMVFFATERGSVYALNAGTGKQVWKFNNSRPRFGFHGAVLLAEDRIFAADLGGRLFALNPTDGKEIWHYDAGAPVMQTPAYNAGQVYFGDEDLQMHAVKTSDGTRLWRSKRLYGKTFISYWPVVVHGKVIVRPLNLKFPYGAAANSFEYAWKEPVYRDLFVLDEDTGEENMVIEHFALGTHSSAMPPPAVTRDGYLVAHCSIRYMDARINHPAEPPEDVKEKGIKAYKGRLWGEHCWALQDLKSGGKFVQILENENDKGKFYWNYKDRKKARHAILKEGIDWYRMPAGESPADEDIIGSVLGEHGVFILSMSWRHIGSFYKRGKYDRAHSRNGGSGGIGGATGTYSFRDREWVRDGIVARGSDGTQFSGGVSAVSGADGLFYSATFFGYVQCLGSRGE